MRQIRAKQLRRLATKVGGESKHTLAIYKSMKRELTKMPRPKRHQIESIFEQVEIVD